ncbi:BA14K family protein [Polycladidibacter stylochi]|uniref:BA14K family protein n=1 Tax=Polycladidibacter stylochi TaxID=1807766 RepID=UPI00083502EF|nr:BA14K family protein [Pseudovibrio stylochi]
MFAHKKAFILVIAAIMVTQMPSISYAKGKHHKHHHQHHHYHHYDDNRHHDDIDSGEAIAIGVLGLAAGLIIASAVEEDNYTAPAFNPYAPSVNPYAQPVYAYPVPAVQAVPAYPQPQPQPHQVNVQINTYPSAPAPWTQQWYRYCTQKYRSFNPQTGTFMSYSGVRKLCR